MNKNHSKQNPSHQPTKPPSPTINSFGFSPNTTTAHLPPPQPPTCPHRPPLYHTNMAATLRTLHDAQPTHYLTYTFPALLCYTGSLIPIVLALEESYPAFNTDVRRILAVPLECGTLMLRVVIAGGLDVYMNEGNMCAVLRHLREARGRGCVVVEELGWPVCPGFEGEGLQRLAVEDGWGRSVF